MAKIEEMNKEQIEEMLAERAQFALDMDDLDKRYPDVFCGVSLDVDNVIHIYKPQVLRKMAIILGENVVVKPYTEEEAKEMRYLGKMWFYFEYGGMKWRVYSIYENESEAVG